MGPRFDPIPDPRTKKRVVPKSHPGWIPGQLMGLITPHPTPSPVLWPFGVLEGEGPAEQG